MSGWFLVMLREGLETGLFMFGLSRPSTPVGVVATPRNLMGLKDGTNNIKAEEEELMDRRVWVSEEHGPSWMVGGTYLVARRIRMLIEV